jgi:hypothetical protein
MAYHLPYFGFLEYDEPWLICVGRKIMGVVEPPYVYMLVIIMVMIMFSIAGIDT